MSLDEQVRSLCHENGIRLNTDIGQHFLIDEEVLEKIIDAANLSSEDTVIEIGPGVGVLTKELVKRAKEVRAIEIDDRMIPILTSYVPEENLTIEQGNALAATFPESSYKIVANIPYHITSPLLRHAFLESKQIPTSLTLLIQKEVAEKICEPTSAGLLTILVQLFGVPHIVTNVPPDCFLPPPKVDSAVLHIQSYDSPKADSATIEKVFSLTKIAFSQKRKKLSNTLGAFPKIKERLLSLGVDLNARPQDLSCDDWIAIASAE